MTSAMVTWMPYSLSMRSGVSVCAVGPKAQREPSCSGRHNKKPAEKLRKPGYQSVYAFGIAIDWPHAFVKEG